MLKSSKFLYAYIFRFRFILEVYTKSIKVIEVTLDQMIFFIVPGG